MNISCDQSDPYGGIISTFIKREFPVFVRQGDSALLDLLTEAIVASGQVRFGPKPSPESLVAIREIITHYVSNSQPIPFLIPWGSEKPDGTGVDIAELFALKTIVCLQKRITNYYPAGIRAHVRIEDASAPHLFFENPEKARRDAALYTTGLVTLARIVTPGFVVMRPESTMTTEEAFNAIADAILPHMLSHVTDPDNPVALASLQTYGWRVPLTPDTLQFYLDRYTKLYPDKTMAERRAILARYFAGALTRITLGITGADPAWNGRFLELAFTAPTPGIGAQRGLRRVYYRTMPSNITSNHMAAWRAKGYLRLGEEVSASLASFHQTDLALNSNTITLSGNGYTQDVQADYVIL